MFMAYQKFANIAKIIFLMYVLYRYFNYINGKWNPKKSVVHLFSEPESV